MAQPLGLLPVRHDWSCQQPTAKASHEASHVRPSDDLPAKGGRPGRRNDKVVGRLNEGDGGATIRPWGRWCSSPSGSVSAQNKRFLIRVVVKDVPHSPGLVFRDRYNRACSPRRRRG
jgi:hypothetical protein